MAYREFLEFDVVQHKELKEYRKFRSNLFDFCMGCHFSKRDSSLDPVFIKVPSKPCNNHFEMLKVLRDNIKEMYIFLWNDYKRGRGTNSIFF